MWGCAHLPGPGVVKVPHSVIKRDAINAVSEKYTQVRCSMKKDETTPGCVKGFKKDSWIDLMKQCQVVGTSDVYTSIECVNQRHFIANELLMIINHN